jgi:hypothetical protein
MPLTGTVDAANARIDLFVDFTATPGSQVRATLTRHVGSLTAPGEYVRGLDDALLLGQKAYVSDHEARLDEPVWYTATADDGSVMTAGPFTVPGNGLVWMKDPGRPWADLSLDLCLTPSRDDEDCGPVLQPPLAWVGFTDRVRAADAGLFPVLDRERPADVYARRKDITTSARFLSRTRASIDDVYDLYTVGGPLLIQVPVVYAMDYPRSQRDRYYQPDDLTESVLGQDQRKPARLWSVPLTAVDAPVGPPQGTDTANWCVLAETYPTMGDYTASGYTWADAAAGIASGPEPLGYGDGLYGAGLYGG